MADLITLAAPCAGLALSLDAVPDRVFAGRMMGDGGAIDPLEGTLHAPCDGEVLSIHAGRHAVTMRGPAGVELLMHIGIDTVSLGGAPFEVLVTPGQRVTAGNPLIRFDMDAIALAAPSLVTPIVIVNGDRFAVASRIAGRRIERGEAFLDLRPLAIEDAAPVSAGARFARRITLSLPHGIHARPAARIGEHARRYDAVCTIAKGELSANARSVVELMGLAAHLDDEIEIAATGPDAERLVTALCELIHGGMGETNEVAAVPAPHVPLPAGAIGGVPASPGLAVGHARWLRVSDRAVEQDGAGVEVERARISGALGVLRDRLSVEGGTNPVATAHLEMLGDPALTAAVDAEIAAGRSAGHGWRSGCRAMADRLVLTGDRRLAERADDYLDLERRVLGILAGDDDAVLRFEPGTILVADDLLPSQIAALGSEVVGLAVGGSGPTAHIAILAAGRGLPAVVAIGEAIGEVADGNALILNGTTGAIERAPSPERLAEARAAVEAAARAATVAVAAAADAAITRDGHRIEVFANLGSLADAEAAVAAGAEGCGLLRTEFLFLDRASPPDVEEQAALYDRIGAAMAGRPVIVRLLDVGGDKPAPYLDFAAEENPALGLRGIRVGLTHRALLETQVAAILRAAEHHDLRIMVPMIASVEELEAVRAVVAGEAAKIGRTRPIPLGIMVETPAAAMIAAQLARRADFFSIGTNDLTQYALAMDRGNPAVASGIDGLHPAVLALIAATARGAERHARMVGLCGGLASDPLAVPLLVGLGVEELSATPNRVPEVKALVRRLSRADCRALAEAALAAATVAEVRALALRFQQELPA